jgi:rubrerythrin
MDLVEIMTIAIRAEVEARKLYLKGEAAATTDDARALFRQLATEEEKHKRLLLAKYEQLAGKEFTQW